MSETQPIPPGCTYEQYEVCILRLNAENFYPPGSDTTALERDIANINKCGPDCPLISKQRYRPNQKDV